MGFVSGLSHDWFAVGNWHVGQTPAHRVPGAQDDVFLPRQDPPPPKDVDYMSIDKRGPVEIRSLTFVKRAKYADLFLAAGTSVHVGTLTMNCGGIFGLADPVKLSVSGVVSILGNADLFNVDASKSLSGRSLGAHVCVVVLS